MVPKNDIDGKTINDYHQRCPCVTKHEGYLEKEKVFLWFGFPLPLPPIMSACDSSVSKEGS